MAIRKPSVSVTDAKRLAKSRWDEPTSRLPDPAPIEKRLPQETGVRRQVETETETQAVRPETMAPSPLAEPVKLARRMPVDSVFPEVEPAEPKIQVFLSAPLPAAGISCSFDALIRQYSPSKALQMILRRALGGYEILIENGSFRTAPTDYPIGEPAAGITIIQTSRMIPLRLVDVVRSHFDPLGFESTRAFGRKLACAALATFFEAERKPRK
ncbi:VirC2 family conjugal transfer protein [Ensifer sp. YR511]|uniref:VirC2 family conjugal transfer protein n=1 Tax=Ensifer sp. YR511 TaxID=1855294 RepID=UPI000B7F184C|nr:VirC2 family conjugal transfer protein [Ensifer sp. YR511]